MDFKEYESFVAELYYAVQTTEQWTTNLKTVSFELNKKIPNSYGVEREFDIYWEYLLDDETHRAVIECKNYTSRIPIDKVDALIGKLAAVEEGITPIFATRTGYQSGAKKAADHHEVELLIAREQDLSDWTAEDGKAVVKHVHINIILSPPAIIHNFSPTVDGDWVKKHTDIDTSQSFTINEMNNEIFINDESERDRYSIQDLAGRLVEGKDVGRFQELKKFTNAYIEIPKRGKLKLVSFAVDYSVPPPIRDKVEIDFGDALVGVLEYLQKGEKKLVFKNKVNNSYVVRTETVR